MTSEQIHFLRRHPIYAVSTICLFYPLQAEQLRKFRHILFWDDICENRSINWSIGLMQTFINHLVDENGKFDSALYSNEGIPWSVELIGAFEKYWQWDALGEIKVIQDNPEIQATFTKHLSLVNEWIAEMARGRKHYDDYGLAVAEKVWTVTEVERDKDKIDWMLFSSSTSFNWSMQHLLQFETYFDYLILSGNENVWRNCFGDFTDNEMEALLSDKPFLSDLQACKNEIKAKVYDESELGGTSIIPACLTFEYFVKNRTKI